MNKLALNLLIISSTLSISNKTFAQANNGTVARTDTAIFKASTYVIQPNDKLDDLLKKMISFTIQRDGKITAQGDTIARIFVDGEEFYSDSPATAAHILRADKVELVKVYWRLADQDAFTGIDNRKRQKVINVILKK
ncbi:hypothetical protein [Mucilaginibacter auburnensis]|uniref:hypothetical protein n=1 Tax=Mucilaginibacter auburnensis TaxID=1457233 RepID=UPI000C2403A8|nr:hypothetical protein [Mucilaginibacter auburnensis]